MEPVLVKIIPEFKAPWGETFRDARVYRSLYTDGVTPALFINADDGEPLCTVTVNLSDSGIFPPPGEIIVKDYSENEGLAEVLVACGLLSLTGREVIGSRCLFAKVLTTPASVMSALGVPSDG